MKNRMRGWGRVVSLALLGGTLGWGCGGEMPPKNVSLPSEGEMADELGAAAKPVSVRMDTVWKNLKIPVCWEFPIELYPKERAWVENAIFHTWQRTSLVQFTGWGSCKPGQPGVHIRVADEANRVYGAYLGNQFDGVGGAVTLNFIFDRVNPAGCRSSETRREACIRVAAVHEFGHVLGFPDEQNHPNSTCLTERKYQPTVPLDGYDPDSVMNLCNTRYINREWPFVLSSNDVRGVQTIYGGRAGMIVGYWGRCLDRVGGATANGTLLHMWDCHGFDAQTWTVWLPDKIMSRAFGGALDVPSAYAYAGARVQYWYGPPYASAQQFRFREFMIRGYGGKCLTGESALSWWNGEALMNDCNNGPAQRWEYENGNKIKIAGMCLTVFPESPIRGVFGVGVDYCDWYQAPHVQEWIVRDGNITNNALPGYCLGVENFNTGPGSKVTMRPCISGTNQRWGFRGRIQHANGQMVLDVRNMINANGTPVQIYPYNGTAAQQWDYYP